MRQAIEIRYQDGSVHVVGSIDDAIERLELGFFGGRRPPPFSIVAPTLSAAGISVPRLHVLSHAASKSTEGDVSLTVHDLGAQWNRGTAVSTYELDGILDPDTILSRAILTLVETETGEDFREEVAHIEEQLVSRTTAALTRYPTSGMRLSDRIAGYAFRQPREGILPDPSSLVGTDEKTACEAIVSASVERFREAVEIVAREARIDMSSARSFGS